MASALPKGRIFGASRSTTAASWIVGISQLFYFANHSYASIRQWPVTMGAMSLLRSSCLILAVQLVNHPKISDKTVSPQNV